MAWGLLISTLATVLAYAAGEAFDLFESLFWYDKLVHFAGGIWVAFIAMWVYKRRGLKASALTVLVFVFLVGIGWELFEFGLTKYFLRTFGYSPALQPSHLDTVLDVITNLLGAGAAVLVTSIRRGPSRK